MPPARERTHNELRCECRRRPLLAVFGINEKGKVYLHVKVYKNRRVFGEILITGGGDVQLRCRECFRWYTVTMPASGIPKLVETVEPDSLTREAAPDHV